MSSQEISGPFKVRNNRSELGDELAIVNGNLSFTGVSKSIVLDSFTNSSNLTFNKGKGNYSLNPSISVNSINIANTPINDTHAATVGYVKQFVQGLDAKESVKCATTGELALLFGSQTVDGVNLVGGERVLVKDQTNKTQNGIYLANSAGNWSRAADFNEPHEVQGAFVFVEQGSQNAAKGFVQVSAAPVTIGSGPLLFTQFNGTNPAINDLINGKLASNATDFSGNAATATKLKTARAIGGVNFDGSADIDLPGVNSEGNQNTSGSAAKLTTARAIGGVNFDGSADIDLPGVNIAGNQDTSGNAATASAAKPNSDLEITLNAKLNKSVFDTSFSTITISNATPSDTSVTGKIVFNTTNNVLYIYTGSGWQSVVAPQA